MTTQAGVDSVLFKGSRASIVESVRPEQIAGQLTLRRSAGNRNWTPRTIDDEKQCNQTPVAEPR